MFHRNTEKLESFIGANSTFRGEIDTKGTLRIDGTIEGNISADWIVIGASARIKGDISGRGIVVGGTVEGNLKATEIVEIKNKGQLFGEIFTNKLNVVEGAIFEGKSMMLKEESKEENKIVELQVREKSK